MSIPGFLISARDRARLAEVLTVARRFGVDGLMARFGLADAKVGQDPPDLPTRTRQALETLGPTYIKLGQILATRRDLLDDRWTAALEELQSGATRIPFEQLQSQVEASLGEPVETAFARFDREPLAAASMAQVHRAELHDGQQVVLKIRRPGIRAIIEADLRLIRQAIGLAQKTSAELRRFDPVAMVDQLTRDLLDELDFTREGRNADLLRADFADQDAVVLPGIHWQWTSEDLLVMDYIDGIAPRDPESLRQAGIDPDRMADLGAATVLDMVLVNGRFHGDPHPGNLLCLPGNRLALLDLGSIGIISPRRQHEFLTFVLGLRGGDPQAVADMLAVWSGRVAVPRERVVHAAERMVARHGSGPLVINALIADFFPLLRSEGMVLPPDLLLIFKAMVTMDGVLAQISPGFDLSQALDAAQAKIAGARLSALLKPERAEALLLELSRIVADAPHLIRSASAWIDRQPAEPPPPLAPAIMRAGWLIAAALLVLALSQIVG